MPKNIAIVGSGPAGAGFLSGLVSLSNDPKNRGLLAENTIHIFEKSAVFGAGLPYDSSITAPEHLLNIQTVSGSIPKSLDGGTPDPESFLKWMKNNEDFIKDKFLKIFKDRFNEKAEKRFGKKSESEYQKIPDWVELKEHYDKLWSSFEKRYLDLDKAKDFHPRILYGMFSISNFEKDLEILKSRGINVVLHPQSTVSRVDGDKNLSFIENGEEKSERFAKIFIATGMMDDTKENEENSPVITKLWPIKEVTDRLEKLIDEAKESGKSNVKIAVKGTGLAAIDLVKTIFRDGLFESDEAGKLAFIPNEEGGVKVIVDMISRTGILPKVRGSWDETPESANKYGNMAEFNQRIQKLNRDEDGKLPLWLLISNVAEEMSRIYKEAGFSEEATGFKSFANFANEVRNNSQIFERFLSYRNPDAFLELESDVSQALNEYGSPKDIIWQNIYNQLTGFATLLNESDKDFFDGLIRWRQNYSTPMPAKSAKELIALNKAGVLHVKALGREHIEEIDGKVVKVNSQSGTENYDLVINATGARLGVESIKGSNSPLYKSLEQLEEEGRLKIVGKNTPFDDHDDMEIVISRVVGGIEGARKSGNRAAEKIMNSLIKELSPGSVVSNPTSKVASSNQGINI